MRLVYKYLNEVFMKMIRSGGRKQLNHQKIVKCLAWRQQFKSESEIESKSSKKKQKFILWCNFNGNDWCLVLVLRVVSGAVVFWCILLSIMNTLYMTFDWIICRVCIVLFILMWTCTIEQPGAKFDDPWLFEMRRFVKQSGPVCRSVLLLCAR